MTACISGPKDEEKSFAEKLNGDSYKSSVSVGGAIPINIERKPVQRKFSGVIYCGEGPSSHPVSNASLSLVADTKILTKSSSVTDGRYRLIALTTSVGPFEIKATARCGSATRTVSAKLEDRVPSYDLFLK